MGEGSTLYYRCLNQQVLDSIFRTLSLTETANSVIPVDSFKGKKQDLPKGEKVADKMFPRGIYPSPWEKIAQSLLLD